MSRRAVLSALALSGLSAACGFAGLGVALYGTGSHGVAAAGLFGAIGFFSGVASFGLPQVFDRLPAQARLATGLPASQGRSPLHLLARATLAAVQQSARDAAGAARRSAPPAELPRGAVSAADVAAPAAAAPRDRIES